MDALNEQVIDIGHAGKELFKRMASVIRKVCGFGIAICQIGRKQTHVRLFEICIARPKEGVLHGIAIVNERVVEVDHLHGDAIFTVIYGSNGRKAIIRINGIGMQSG